MELFEAIFGRISQGKVKQDPVTRQIIEKLLEAAVQAPNHYKVRPWRFVVLTGRGRERLGEVMATSMFNRHPELGDEALEKIRKLALRAPLLIVVGVDKPTEPNVIEIENLCAASAACENLLLAAQALGLASKWRTGEWANDQLVREFLGFEKDQLIAAFLYIGYPEFSPDEKERPSFHDRVRWIEQ